MNGEMKGKNLVMISDMKTEIEEVKGEMKRKMKGEIKR